MNTNTTTTKAPAPAPLELEAMFFDAAAAGFHTPYADFAWSVAEAIGDVILDAIWGEGTSTTSSTWVGVLDAIWGEGTAALADADHEEADRIWADR